MRTGPNARTPALADGLLFLWHEKIRQARRACRIAIFRKQDETLRTLKNYRTRRSNSVGNRAPNDSGTRNGCKAADRKTA